MCKFVRDRLNFHLNSLLCFPFLSYLIFFFFVSKTNSVIIGLILCLSFAFGCALSLALLKHKKWLSLIIVKVKKYSVFGGVDECASTDCDVCGASKCNRHGIAPNREPWKGIFVDANLDRAVESVSCSSRFQISIHVFCLFCFRSSCHLCMLFVMPLCSDACGW